MLEALPKAAFGALAGSSTIKALASRYGMRRPESFARRFIAGEHLEDGIEAARGLAAERTRVTLDYLGESVTSREAANAATATYLDLIRHAVDAGIEVNLSLKLTQLGLDIDPATSIDNLRRVLDVAAAANGFVRVDMENSPYTDATIAAIETVWGIGHHNVGTVIQAYLKRSPHDIRRLSQLGSRVRLVKGAYREPSSVALQRKQDVDAAFVDLMKELMVDGTYPAIATHDPAMITATKDFATARGIGLDRFEFQMLYGVRRDLQADLMAAGYTVRVYVPFGREWFPYFMRRLGERPANVGFVIRAVLQERV
jgi:proline dehydrogenase